MKNISLANITPGEILEEDFLKPMGLKPYQVPKDIGVSARRINEIVNGSRATPPTPRCGWGGISSCRA